MKSDKTVMFPESGVIGNSGMDSSREATAIFLHWGKVVPAELNAMKIAKFMGRATRLLQLSAEAIGSGQFLDESVPLGACLVTSAQTLSQACNERGLEWLAQLKQRAANIFVYGFEAARHSLVLRDLSSGSCLDVEPLPPGDLQFRVAENAREICRQFTGLAFGTAEPDTDSAFVEGGEQSHSSALIRIGRKPFVVCTKHRNCQVMLLAGRGFADLDRLVPRDTSSLRFFSTLAPLMMFIASASGNGVWHNDTPRACFIVDDPLLRRRYGFLDYQKLLDSMERRRFCTSIAFIPWNFARSDRELADLFVSNPRRYSLCVHGSDHTKGEFGATQLRWLGDKAREALDRMVLHRNLSGVGFDDIMVFPQGIFSTVAMEALKSCRYLAAVNSTPYPIDTENCLTLRDLLEVAVTRFSNFPLFTRKTPDNLAELAFDLFVGKPALLVEHHGYFREGYAAIEDAVEKVCRLDERLQWTNLATACAHACLKRVAANGDVHVWFFTDRFSLRNETDRPQNYVLVRKASPDDRATVTMDGRPVDVCYEEDGLKARVTLSSGQGVEVRVEIKLGEQSGSPIRKNKVYHAKVFVRRRLSEFRDNYLDRSRLLSKAARRRSRAKSRAVAERC